MVRMAPGTGLDGLSLTLGRGNIGEIRNLDNFENLKLLRICELSKFEKSLKIKVFLDK